MIRLLAFVFVLLGLIVSSASTTGTAPAAISVTTTTHGLRLALDIPRRNYPRDALVLVHGSVRNVSRHTLWLEGSGNEPPGIGNPEPQVLTGTGKIAYPPAFPYLYPLPGPFPIPFPIYSGTTITRSFYVILAGAHLRLSVRYTTHDPRKDMSIALRSLHRVNSRLVTLHLGTPDPPMVTMRLPPEPLAAIVQRPSGVRGLLLSVEYSDCPDTTANWGFITWTGGGMTLLPDCVAPNEWHVVAGWLGHSVVRVDYVAPTGPAPRVAP